MKRYNPSSGRPISLTSRVMLFVAVAISISLLIIGHLVKGAVESHFEEQDAGELAVITHAVESALQQARDQGLAPEAVLESAVSGHHGVYFQVWNEAQQLIYGTPNAQGSNKAIGYTPRADVEADRIYLWSAGEKIFRGTVTQTRVGGHQYRIVAAIDMDFHLQFLEKFNQSLLIIMSLAGVVTLLAAWAGVHQGHAPLRALREAIREIQADRLDMRLDTATVPAELITLVDAFNRMLERLEDSFDRLSHFSSDIAHEMRTPLTNLITQTQVGLGKTRSLEEYRELLYSSLEEQERLTKMVNDMLWLAQSENGSLRPVMEEIELLSEVQAIFEYFEALAEDKNVRLQVEGESTVITGDRAMLRRALSNLLSNALRFTSDGDSVRVRIWQSDMTAYLSMENPGPEIAAEHLPRLFDRFYRVETSRQRQSDGAGLGLAIVKSIVEAHMGAISAAWADGITAFTIRFKKPPLENAT